MPDPAVPSERSAEKGRAILPAILAALVALLVHARCLGGGFVSYDDDTYVLGNGLIAEFPGWSELATIFTTPHGGQFVPLTVVSYGLDRLLPGGPAFGGHLTNLLLHALVSALVTVLARRAGAHARGAALAGIFFACHPLGVETVGWIAERKGLLVALALGLSLLAFHRALDAARAGPADLAPARPGPADLAPARPGPADLAPARPGRWLLVSVVLFAAALGFKPTAITFPGVLVLELARRRALRRAPLVAPFAVLSGAWMALTLSLVRHHGIMKEKPEGLLRQLRTIVSVHAHYLEKILVPWPLAVRYDLDWAPPELEARDLVATALVAGAAFLALALLRKGRPGLLLILGHAVVTLATVSGAFKISALATDRYTYLPLVAVAVGVGVLAERGARLARGPTVAACALVVGLFSLGAATRERDWADEARLWTHEAETVPRSPFGPLALAKLCLARGELDAAERHALEAQRRRVEDRLVLPTLAEIAHLRGDVTARLRYLSLAEAVPGGFPLATLALVDHRLEQGDPEGAARHLAPFLAAHPDDAKLLRAAGHVAASRGRWDVAERSYLAAVRATPSDGAAWLDLTNALAHRNAREEALVAIEEARRRCPDDPRVSRERGILLSDAGRLAEARKALERARAQGDTSARLSLALADVLARTGDLASAEALLERAVADAHENERATVLVTLAKVQVAGGHREAAARSLAAVAAIDSGAATAARQDPLLRDLR